MQTEGTSVEAILGRLEKLERQNRWLRAAVTAAGLAVAALALMAVARPAPQVITAQKFRLVDRSGHVRARLNMAKGMPTLILYTSAGYPQALLSGGPQPFLTLNGPPRAAGMAAGLSITGSGPQLVLAGGSAMADLTVTGPGPALTLQDAAGFATNIGVTKLVNRATGEARQTSAASIEMFDNSKKRRVIWQAPPAY